jgi:hypothetical protein
MENMKRIIQEENDNRLAGIPANRHTDLGENDEKKLSFDS